MKHVKNVTNNTPVNKEDTNMDQNNNATVNAAEAAATEVRPEDIQVPTPPAQEEAQQAQPAKEKKPGLIKKILLIIGAILALITGGFIAGRVSGKKADRDDDDLEYVDIDNDQNG